MHSHSASDSVLEVARELISRSSRIVALTGAGISTDSGIPDFRGPNGVWTRDPEAEKQSTLSYYLSDPAIRERAWRSRMDHRAWTAEPNAGHLALVELERQGKLAALVTQNIDGLHQEAGSDPDLVIEIHGTVREVTCLTCGWRGPMQETLERVRAGEADPACLDCGGILKSATISFGQNLVQADVERAFSAAERADLILAVGTTLGVYPVANIVPVGARAGASVIIVNGEVTEMDDLATVVVRGSISEVLPLIIGQ